jgi:ABC-2 type transport system permease protein
MTNLKVARAVAGRSLRHAFTNPALLLPSLAFPLIFLLSFAGGLSAVENTPGFDFRSGYTSFQFVFVLLQSAAFGGIFAGFGVAFDFESGFMKRLFLAAPSRGGIVLGYLFSGLVRASFTIVVLTIVGLIVGMEVDGSAPQYLALVALALLLNVVSTLFATGFAMRTRSMQAAPAMQLPVFLLLFAAPVFVPLALLDGWLHAVASWNPATALLEAGRGFISGVPDHSALAYLVVSALIAIMALWALRSLRKAEAAG